MLLISGCVASLPSLISLQTFKPRLESQLSGALGAPVKVRAYRLGWLSGAALDGLEIGHPAGFTAERPLLTLERARLSVSWLRALSGSVDVAGEVHGVRLLVLQNRDGMLNVQALGGADRDEKGRDGSIEIESDEDQLERFLPRLRADVALRDVAIDVVHEEKGTLESIRKLDATIDKRFGTTDFDVKLDAELAAVDASRPPGKLQLDADVDATLRRPIDVQLTTAGFDFARYRTLLDNQLGPGSLTACAGVLNGTVKARIENKQTVFVQGALTVEQPHFAGALLRGMSVQAPKWVVNPNMKLTMQQGADQARAVPQADLAGFSVDLGLLRVAGVAAEAASALFAGAPAMALDFDLDLQALGKLGGPIPAQLAQHPGSLAGRAALKVPAGGFAMSDVTKFVADALHVQAAVKLPQLAVGSATHIAGVDLPFTFERGSLRASLSPGATLNGGPLTLTANADLTQPTWPLRIEAGVQETSLVADALHAVQYAVPVLAGLTQQAGAELAGKGTLSFAFHGPGNNDAGDSWLAWLNRWSGDGKLALAQANVRPAPAFAALMQLADPDGQGLLALKDFATDFRLRQGGVETALGKLDIKGKKLGLSGRTNLDGTLDHKLDLTELLGGFLSGHRDGERVLQYLQGKTIASAVQGTLWSPKLVMPDIQALIAEALKNAAQQELKKGVENALQKGLEELLKKKKD
jgi:hypothetical protein